MWREKNIYFTEHDIYFSKLMFILKNINLELKSALRTKYIFYRILLYTVHPPNVAVWVNKILNWTNQRFHVRLTPCGPSDTLQTIQIDGVSPKKADAKLEKAETRTTFCYSIVAFSIFIDLKGLSLHITCRRPCVYSRPVCQIVHVYSMPSYRYNNNFFSGWLSQRMRTDCTILLLKQIPSQVFHPNAWCL